MKSILVPTDFSNCARQAEQAAVQLAERFGARLHLLHQVSSSGRAEEEAAYQEALQREKNAEVLFRDLQAAHPGVDMEGHCSREKLSKAVADYVMKKGIDLVVMGSHGVSGKSEYFIGSNTQRIVRTIHRPVLVIKEPPARLQFDRVIFASSFNQSEREPFLRFKEFVKHFLPEIHLVAIHTSSLFDPPYVVSKEAMEEFKALCAPFTCHTHVYRDFTIEHGIRSFANDVDARLIGISNYERHPLKRMLVGSNVEALINHAQIPVLSIDYEEAERAQTDPIL